VAAAPSGIIEVGALGAELTLMAHAVGGHPYLARLKAKVSGPNGSVALKAKHLVQALRTIDTEVVELGFNGRADRLVIRGIGRWGADSDHIELVAHPR
jgi:DNA polymerase III sliding clamp (beta) subunit (PCNA family)